MSAGRDGVRKALARLGVAVAGRLSAQGWVGRTPDHRTVTTVTRTRADGVMVAVEVVQTSWRWPVKLVTRIGVGHEAALNLMPLVTLPPRPILAEDATRLPVSLAGPGDVEPTADRIVDWVQERAGELAARYTDAAAVDAELERQIPAAAGRGTSRRNGQIRRRLVLLAATGRLDEARALLATFRAGAVAQPAGRRAESDARFVRQLSRWLDRGAPPAPPVEETLAVVAPPSPRTSLPPRASLWAAGRAMTRSRRAAFRAARARSAGKTVEELKELVAAEHTARGLPVQPSRVALEATRLQVEQRPFGRVRWAVRAVGMAAAFWRDIISQIRRRVPADPDWIRPPERAGYRVLAGSGRFGAVQLDASARDWMSRVQAHAPRRFGPYIRLDAWLTRDGATGHLVVHIGERRVGTVHPGDAHRFEHAMTAAALFDEDPVVDAMLMPADGPDSAPILELPLPAVADDLA